MGDEVDQFQYPPRVMPQRTDPSPGPPLAKVRGLHHHYAENPVLKGLDFDLSEGRITVFLGRNGAGKSTTLAILAGILHPKAGQVTVAGHSPWSHVETRGRIGYLPERPPLYPQLDVSEHLEFVARLHGLDAARRPAMVRAAIERFDLTPVRNRLAGRLSKGYQQRLGLALALVHEPQLVLLDEPGNGLDPVQIKRLRDTIHELKDQATVLYSTHMLNEALAVGDDLLVLCEGRLTFAGNIGQIAQQDAAEARLLDLMCGQEATA